MANNSITLEGNKTPNIILNDGEEVLLDVSQGIRDLGLAGWIFRHKGRLIATNQRAIYFKKKTKDYEIQQMNMRHAGYIKTGYNLQFKQFLSGIVFLLMGIGAMQQIVGLGVALLIIGAVVAYTARIQGLVLSGSGDNIVFASKSIAPEELSKIITIVAANS